MSEYSGSKSLGGQENPTLTVGIPAGRTIDWTERIMSGLEYPSTGVEVLVARWDQDPLTDRELEGLNMLLPTREVASPSKDAPTMRNTIVREAVSTHILFLDDDMVPGQNLLSSALAVARREPDAVHQGIPYRVANHHNWLARTEGRLYEVGYQKYIDVDDNVTLLDPRLMLASTETLLETPFDESLVFSSGEGTELAISLMQRNVPLRLARELDAAHINRDTVASLASQKRNHGLGRGYELAKHGPGENGWLSYFADCANRHYVQAVVKRAKGEMNTGEMLYVWGTHTAFWAGVFEYMVRESMAGDQQ